jgi:hypothetical protein
MGKGQRSVLDPIILVLDETWLGKTYGTISCPWPALTERRFSY